MKTFVRFFIYIYISWRYFDNHEFFNFEEKKINIITMYVILLTNYDDGIKWNFLADFVKFSDISWTYLSIIWYIKKQNDSPADQPAEPPAEQPTHQPGDLPGDRPADRPAGRGRRAGWLAGWLADGKQILMIHHFKKSAGPSLWGAHGWGRCFQSNGVSIYTHISIICDNWLTVNCWLNC